MGGGLILTSRNPGLNRLVLPLANSIQGGRDGDGGGGASTRYAGAGGDPFGDVEEDEGASGNPGLSDLRHTGGTAERAPVTTPPLMCRDSPNDETRELTSQAWPFCRASRMKEMKFLLSQPVSSGLLQGNNGALLIGVLHRRKTRSTVRCLDICAFVDSSSTFHLELPFKHPVSHRRGTRGWFLYMS